MHEGAVCAEIIDVVTAAATANNIKQVSLIELCVGPYSCLNLEQLNFYFDAIKVGTCMEEAVITMERDENLSGISQMFVKSISGE